MQRVGGASLRSVLVTGSAFAIVAALVVGIRDEGPHRVWELVADVCIMVLALGHRRWRTPWVLIPVALGIGSLTVALTLQPDRIDRFSLLLYLLAFDAAPLLSWPLALGMALMIFLAVEASIAHWMLSAALHMRSSYVTDLAGIAIATVLAKGGGDSQRQIDQLNQALKQMLRQEKEAGRRTAVELERILDFSLDIIMTFDFDGRVKTVNSAVTTILGYAPTELIGQRYSLFVHPEEDEAVRMADAVLADRRMDARFETRVTHRNGSWVWVEVAARPLPDEDMVFCVLRDITERKRAEELLRKANAVVENSAAVLFRWKAQPGWPVEYVSDNVVQFGLTRSAVLCSTFRFAQVVHPDDYERFSHARAGLLNTGTKHILEYRVLTGDGGPRWVQERAVAERDAQGQVTHVQGVVLDITDAKTAEEQVSYLAFHDPLTTLPNRVVFMDRVHQALLNAAENPHSFALLFLDLDGFKQVNDYLGHEAGDQLLQEIAKDLRACTRASDLVARIGGDEFTVLLEATPEPLPATQLADRILQTLRRVVTVGDHEVTITASIGVVYGDQGRDAEDLLRKADAAMYCAKQKGKAHYEVFRLDRDVAPVTP